MSLIVNSTKLSITDPAENGPAKIVRSIVIDQMLEDLTKGIVDDVALKLQTQYTVKPTSASSGSDSGRSA